MALVLLEMFLNILWGLLYCLEQPDVPGSSCAFQGLDSTISKEPQRPGHFQVKGPEA